MRDLLVEMESLDKQKRIYNSIYRIANLYKSKFVKDVIIKIDYEQSYENTYYISIIYLVEKLGLPSLNDMIVDLADGWTDNIKKSIEDFMNIKVIVTDSKIKFTE